MGADSLFESRFLLRSCMAVLMSCAAACASGDDDTATQLPEVDDGGNMYAEAKCPATLPKVLLTGPSGLTVSDPASGLSARIDDASPQIPDRTSNNTWKIAVTDAAGQPATQATISWACAFMEVHGHGSNPAAVNDLGGGVFEISKQNLSMYGPWAVRLWVDATGAEPNFVRQNGLESGHECDPTNGSPSEPNIVYDFCVPDDRSGAQ